jgi:hypothetical protein
VAGHFVQCDLPLKVFFHEDDDCNYSLVHGFRTGEPRNDARQKLRRPLLQASD